MAGASRCERQKYSPKSIMGCRESPGPRRPAPVPRQPTPLPDSGHVLGQYTPFQCLLFVFQLSRPLTSLSLPSIPQTRRSGPWGCHQTRNLHRDSAVVLFDAKVMVGVAILSVHRVPHVPVDPQMAHRQIGHNLPNSNVRSASTSTLEGKIHRDVVSYSCRTSR